jgi:hypothetical protein
MHRLHPTIAAALLIVAVSASAQQTSAQSGIGYPSVAAALEALKARPDVKISVRDGWTIVNDPISGAVWSFTPSSHPAHPAAVKRTVVEKNGQVFLDMQALCQASKAACDKLIAEFQELNEKTVQAARTRAPAAQESDIQVERLGDDSYRLVLKSFRSPDVEAGQRELLPKAREVCAGRNVNYGKYQYETAEPVSPSAIQRRQLVLRQEIRCGGAGGAPATATGSELLWTPTPAQDDLIKRQTHAYFAARDGGKYREAYSMFSRVQQQTVPFDSWSSREEEFNSKAGPVKKRTIKKITWYKDPPRAAPGIYAAVDFASEFANIDIHCGFVAWQMQEDGSFRVIREEVNVIDKAMQQKLKAGQIDRIRAQFGAGCR